MIQKDRHSICAACGMSYVRGTRRGQTTCSPECGKAIIHKKKACVPECDPKDQAYREVIFSSGRIMGQRYCLSCKRAKIVARKPLA